MFVGQLAAPCAEGLGGGAAQILLDVVEAWQAAGSPHQSGFGITVTRESQRVWLGTPDGPGWDLPV